MNKKFIAVVLLLLLCLCEVKAQKKDTKTFIAFSPAFVNNGVYPKLFTCDSIALSPPISWKNTPNGTKSIAITMHHIPRDGEKHVYMVLYNIPADISGIPQADSNIGFWGHNSMNPILGYSPPCSKGPGEKAYIITVYALSETIPHQNEGLTMEHLLQMIKDKILETSVLTVKYSR
ncbi:YbhB/YbcL family Raf kinase inhibitor-like protein [uncultured Mucilaginibacter sp.]|uniref:YbhB/YbcL family Raf kinase inhibitor-like protein n=1 Tax=uncultured Mucilaginibacter sp. TaxID=797541 RepID=UPI0025D8597C|nr:YbhB/YbcL family Raf kinase inhibitor-like protein [uncultured Mucilaginibacter sp.]